MPKLACRTCGRQLYTAAPDAPGTHERRCPRCGARLDVERRRSDRRFHARRVNPADDPGPPPGLGERRAGDRRRTERRRDEGAGWATR